MKKVVVYTAVAGRFDTLMPLTHKNPNTNYVAYSDEPLKSDFWEVKPMKEYYHPNPRRRTRYFKMHPHKLFPKADITVWVDASTDFNVPLKRILNKLQHYDLVGRTHPVRTCLYEEAIACVRLGYPHKPIFQQVRKYLSENFPKNYGLIECRLLVRKNNNTTNKFNELWFAEYTQGSERDQISMEYCAWKTGLKTVTVPLNWLYHRPHNHEIKE